MTNNVFLNNLLTGNYKEMTVREFEILAKYDNIFNLGKKFEQLVNSLKKKESEEKRTKIVEYIEEKIPLRFFILNRLDNYTIYEDDLVIDFKTAFYENLDKMNSIRLCYLIDRMTRLNEKYHINFFGHITNGPIAYHKFNEVISKAYRLNYAYGYFGKGAPSKWFKIIRFERIDRDLLAQRIKEYAKLYFPILEGISEYLLYTKDEDLDSRKELLAMNKKMKIYFDILQREHKVVSGEVKDKNRTWKYLIDSREVEDKDFGDFEGGLSWLWAEEKS